MAELIPIQVPVVNPNEVTATLIEWLVAHDATVTVGQVVVRMETTKTVVDVDSPATGRLECRAEIGAELSVGAILGFVEVSAATSDPAHGPVMSDEGTDTVGEEALASEGPPDGRVAAVDGNFANSSTNIRLTRRAQLLARRIGVDPATLGLVGLVRTHELLEAVERGLIPAEITDEQMTEHVKPRSTA